MSEESVEVVMDSFRLNVRDDPEDWAALWHPESRATAPEGWPEQGPFVGGDAIVQEFKRVYADWSEYRFEDIKVVAEAGEWVVVTYRWHTRGATSGIEADFDLAAAFQVKDGQIIEAHFRWRPEEALEAAGLSE
jgi:ketosteroid isomerase-like protein